MNYLFKNDFRRGFALFQGGLVAETITVNVRVKHPLSIACGGVGNREWFGDQGFGEKVKRVQQPEGHGVGATEKNVGLNRRAAPGRREHGIEGSVGSHAVDAAHRQMDLGSGWCLHVPIAGREKIYFGLEIHHRGNDG